MTIDVKKKIYSKEPKGTECKNAGAGFIRIVFVKTEYLLFWELV